MDCSPVLITDSSNLLQPGIESRDSQTYFIYSQEEKWSTFILWSNKKGFYQPIMAERSEHFQNLFHPK